MASISFNGNQLLRELDLVTQVQLPFLGMVTLNRLATVVRKDIRSDMEAKFERVVPFTLNSVQQNHPAKKDQLWTEVFLLEKADKGNAAASYLLPQIKGGFVYKTRFQRRLESQLKGYNGRYMLPLDDSDAARLTSKGRVAPSQYVEALYGVRATGDIQPDVRNAKKWKMEGKYVYIPYVGSDPEKQKPYRAMGRGRIPTPGIYRVYARKEPIALFYQLKDIPTVAAKFDFVGTAQSSVQANFASIFNQVQQQYVRR